MSKLIMGSVSFSFGMVKMIVFVSLLCFCFNFYGCKGCFEDERIAFLQLWNSFINNPNGSAPAMGDLSLVGDDCCSWGYLKCDLFNSTNHVFAISISYEKRFQGLGKWYPNASLFTQFKELKYLTLEELDIGGWIMPEALCELQNLKLLSLSGNSLDDAGLPRCLAHGLPFLEDISLRGNYLNLSWPLLSALCGLRNLRSLDLRSNVLTDLPPCMLDTFSSLKSLYLSNFTLEQSPIVLTALQGGRNLEYLDLSNNNLTDQSLVALCGAANLKTLELKNSNFNVQCVPPCLQQNLSHLEYLGLHGIFSKGSHALQKGFCGLKKLRKLDLSLIDLNDESLPSCLLHDNSLLGWLNLSSSNLKDSLHFSTGLCGLKKLKVLDLSSTNLSDESLLSCILHNNPLLEKLDLSSNNLKGSLGFSTGLCGLKKLKVLDLSSTNLSDESLLSCILHNNPLLEKLDLSSNNLKGSLGFSTGLCGLKKLKVLDLSSTNLSDESLLSCILHNNPLLEKLDLSSNNLKGSLGFSTGLCGLKKLKVLDLSSTNLSDESLLSCILHNNPLLEKLDLSSNNLKGSLGFSTGVWKLRKLQYLDLSMNSLENISWQCLSELNSLEFLNLQGNQISGTITPFISNLTSLVSLDLSNNKLDGTVFFSMFANLSNLQAISLSNNRMLEVETEFPTWVPSFQLRSLSLENCILNKRTHGIIPSFISTQYKLNELSLSYSSLQGTIPFWLFYNATSISSLNLRGNHLNGPFPLPFKNETSMLKILDISDSNFQGKLPRNIGRFFSNLLSFNMSENKLEGCIPLSFGNSIQVLDLSNNYFVGEVPQSLTQNSSTLSFLILSNNYLHAMANPSNMTNLVMLNLDGNLFTRPFPITPSSVPSLKLLDISRNSIYAYIQDWLPTFPNFLAILMRENHLVGYLPASLCHMQQLRFLDLSNNRLSGSILSCFNNMTSWLEEAKDSLSEGMRWPDNKGLVDIEFIIMKHMHISFATKGNLYSYAGLPLEEMTGLDLSLNQLAGDIPYRMGELRGLRSLNLSHNSLTGHFPESFQNLEKVESLDLSHNKLVGIISPKVIQLTFLSTFNVAYNQLSGKIPYEKNFATFTNDSYIGNLGLCGPPTEINCSSPQPHHNEYKEDDKPSLIDNNLFFYSYVAICYVLGFWAVVAPLLLSRNWRKKYYRVVDPYIHGCSERLFWLLFYMKSCW